MLTFGATAVVFLSISINHARSLKPICDTSCYRPWSVETDPLACAALPWTRRVPHARQIMVLFLTLRTTHPIRTFYSVSAEISRARWETRCKSVPCRLELAEPCTLQAISRWKIPVTKRLRPCAVQDGPYDSATLAINRILALINGSLTMKATGKKSTGPLISSPPRPYSMSVNDCSNREPAKRNCRCNLGFVVESSS